MAAMTLIEARGLAIGHGGRPILNGVDLSLQAGKVLCLLGPNGVGKTTLFRTLLGLIPTLSGTLALGEEPITRLPRHRIAAHLAYVPQAQDLPFAYLAQDIVLMGRSAALGPYSSPSAKDVQLAQAAMQRLGIAHLGARDMTRLSGGQRQMVLIARALAQGAPAIVMDEPTASLDLANRRRIGDLIRVLAGEGKGIILSTHDPDQAAELADEVLLLGPTGVLASGPVQQAMTASALSTLYGTPIRRETLSDGAIHFRALPGLPAGD